MAEITPQFFEMLERDSETVALPCATESDIEAAQQLLGIQFPPSYTQFLRRFNGGEFVSMLIHSVGSCDLTKPLEEQPEQYGQLTYEARSERDFVPEIAEGKMLPFGKSWGGDQYCFDLTQVDGDGEYPVALWNHEYAEELEDAPYVWETLAANFAVFLGYLYSGELGRQSLARHLEWGLISEDDYERGGASIQFDLDIKASVARLMSIIPPPNIPLEFGDESDWARIQEKLGFTLPSDYKKYISTYGSGSFGTYNKSYLWPLNAFSSTHNLDLDTSLLKAYEQCWKYTPPLCPFRLKHQAFPWGQTVNGDLLFWRTEGEPNAWTTIVFNSDLTKYEIYSLAMTNFLTDWISGAIKSDILVSPDPKEIVFIADAESNRG